MGNNLSEIRKILSQIGSTYVAINEYRISFGYIHLLFFENIKQIKAQILIMDCYYIMGETQAGPHVFEVNEIFEDDQSAIILHSIDDSFIVKGLRIRSTDEPWTTLKDVPWRTLK